MGSFLKTHIGSPPKDSVSCESVMDSSVPGNPQVREKKKMCVANDCIVKRLMPACLLFTFFSAEEKIRRKALARFSDGKSPWCP